MLQNVLEQRQATVQKRITVNTVLSVGLIALAVILPQIVHLALGQPGGVQLLPMYLPVLIGGCLLGWKWALSVGVLSPIVSFAITSLMGNPMPALARLPFMIAELAGRAVFLGLVAIFQIVAPFTVPMIWGQICAGWLGLVIQAILVPIIIIAIRAILVKNND